MLKILPWQMDALDDTRASDMNQLFVALLREQLPAETRGHDDDALLAIVARGRAATEAYGMDRDCDVERYLYLMLLLGTDFDESVDWAHDILQREDFTGQVRVDVLWATWEGAEDSLCLG